MANSKIRAIKRNQLDVKAYDDCIAKSPQSKIYARSWYLDAMSDDWYALVKGDYEAVMPLPYRKKFGFSYVYQPLMVQQMGVFPSSPADNQFFAQATSRHLHVNYTFHKSSPEILHHTPKVNLVLHIDEDLIEIRSNISTNRKRDLKKAEQQQLDLRELNDWTNIESLISEAIMKGAYKDVLSQLKKLFLINQTGGAIKAAGVYYQEKCIFFILYGLDVGRVYYLLPISLSVKAQELGIATWTIFKLIEKHKEQYPIFDFEGSSIVGVRRFYESFGSQVESYYQLTKTFFQFMKHAR